MSEFVWAKDPDRAREDQSALAKLVRLERELPPADVEVVLAIGTAYDESQREAVAAGVLFYCSGQRKTPPGPWTSRVEVDFRYIPGLYAFRVGPAVAELLSTVDSDFDIVLMDGQGIAHPRGLGLASHVGVLFDVPVLGFTRQRLFGDGLDPPAGWLGTTQITHPGTGEALGYAISMGEDCAPIYASPGHKVPIEDVVSLVERVCRPGRCYPVALQKAHAMANRLAKSHLG